MRAPLCLSRSALPPDLLDLLDLREEIMTRLLCVSAGRPCHLSSRRKMAPLCLSRSAFEKKDGFASVRGRLASPPGLLDLLDLREEIMIRLLCVSAGWPHHLSSRRKMAPLCLSRSASPPVLREVIWIRRASIWEEGRLRHLPCFFTLEEMIMIRLLCVSAGRPRHLSFEK